MALPLGKVARYDITIYHRTVEITQYKLESLDRIVLNFQQNFNNIITM